MLGGQRPDASHLRAIEQVGAWTRDRFGLPADAVVLVSEVACALPGCPPLETVVAFWTPAGRHHFKVFKTAGEVTPGDLPFCWMKGALVVPEGFDPSCC